MEGKNKNLGGRPRHYSTPKEFDQKVDEYVKWCDEKEEPLTWTGMALFLGFCSRQSIDEYLKYKGFSDSVKRAKAIIENAYEKKLHGQATSGAIFALKNFGWTDKQEVEHWDGQDRVDRDEKARLTRERLIKELEERRQSGEFD